MSASVAVPASRFRADIEGMRAVAVLLVLSNHVFGWPLGGFIGVDVFFVISGFLITQNLLREQTQSRSLSFRDFYVRRVRRLLPAATLVIVVTTLASWLVFQQTRAEATTWDAVASALLVQNWNLIAQGTGYFSAASLPSAFQHYWSLSVEEQFYVVWPWVIIATVFFAGSARWRRVLTVLLVVGAAVSFGLACAESLGRPTWAYFATTTRAWELAAGALIALIPRARLDAWRPASHAMIWTVGLAMIAASAVLIDERAAFPGPWALPAVAGSALMLLASRAGRWQGLLTNRVARTLGRLSYSLYLWHWPLVVFMIAVWPDPGLGVQLLVVIVALLLSYLTYRFVEDPIRRSAWLDRGEGAPRSSRASDRLVGASVAVVVLAATALQFFPPPAPASAEGPAEHPVAFASPESLERSLDEAAGTAEWPALDPAIETIGHEASALAAAQRQGCISPVSADPVRAAEAMADACVLGETDAEFTVVVAGDSIAASWLPTISAAFPDWRVVGVTFESCPAVATLVEDRLRRTSFPRACEQARAAALGVIRELGPDAVFLSAAEGGFARQILAEGEDPGESWSRGTVRAMGAVGAAGSVPVVVIGSAPEGPAPADCAMRILGPDHCASAPSDDWSQKTSSEQDAVAVARMRGVDAFFLKTDTWFCSSSGACPVFADGTPVRVDRGHLTQEYALRLREVFRDAVLDRVPSLAN